ncbi:MAG: Response regulator NasT [uncultured Caballeronia sp.]|nr:MAG: Response regulator NasT [uncultured Caballeronia sp.]
MRPALLPGTRMLPSTRGKTSPMRSSMQPDRCKSHQAQAAIIERADRPPVSIAASCPCIQYPGACPMLRVLLVTDTEKPIGDLR